MCSGWCSGRRDCSITLLKLKIVRELYKIGKNAASKSSHRRLCWGGSFTRNAGRFPVSISHGKGHIVTLNMSKSSPFRHCSIRVLHACFTSVCSDQNIAQLSSAAVNKFHWARNIWRNYKAWRAKFHNQRTPIGTFTLGAISRHDDAVQLPLDCFTSHVGEHRTVCGLCKFREFPVFLKYPQYSSPRKRKRLLFTSRWRRSSHWRRQSLG